jgi:hypothetical protein
MGALAQRAAKSIEPDFAFVGAAQVGMVRPLAGSGFAVFLEELGGPDAELMKQFVA